MNIEAFLLCQCAADSGGKLNVLGAFDCLWANKVPVTCPSCSVTARIRFSSIEQGSHNVRINIIDEDGKAVSPRLESTISVRLAENESSCIRNIILNILQLKFGNYGDYRIDLAIDGRQEASLPLKIVKVHGQKTPGPATG